MGPDGDYLRQQDRRRRRQAGRRRLALTLFLVVVVVAVVLAVTLSGRGQPSTTTSSTTGSEETTTSSTTGSEETTTTSTPGPVAVTYTADLGGGNEIPPITTAASGTLTLTVSPDGTSVSYVFTVSSIISLTVARLHEGQVGASGATIFTIYDGPTKSGLYTGTVAEGSFNADDLGGPLKGKTIDDFVGMIEANSVYLNVGTEAHTDGEIRGQLQ